MEHPINSSLGAAACIPSGYADARCIDVGMCFHRPLSGDMDDIRDWTLRKVKDVDETGALFNHGVYSSTHLLALKYQAGVTSSHQHGVQFQNVLEDTDGRVGPVCPAPPEEKRERGGGAHVRARSLCSC